MKTELRFEEGRGSGLFATENIRQGEVLDSSQLLANCINHSPDPNAAVRNRRLIAWRCIDRGEEITLKKTPNQGRRQ